MNQSEPLFGRSIRTGRLTADTIHPDIVKRLEKTGYEFNVNAVPPAKKEEATGGESKADTEPAK